MPVTIVKVSEKGQIAIPQPIREKMGIEKGDELVIFQADDSILLEKSSKVEGKMKDDFKDIMKLSERSLKKIWSNKKDEIWNNYIKK